MAYRSFTFQKCKAHADEGRRFTNSAVDPKTRAHWLRFAKAWEEMPDEAAAEETLAKRERPIDHRDRKSDAASPPEYPRLCFLVDRLIPLTSPAGIYLVGLSLVRDVMQRGCSPCLLESTALSAR